MPAPQGKHMFGVVSVGERGQIVIPKKAREMFGIKPGDSLMLLGDENGQFPGLALIKNDIFMGLVENIFNNPVMTPVEKEFTETVIKAQEREDEE